MYHFIGMNGIGMSGLAKLLLQQEVAVSGSDQGEQHPQLKKLGARCFQGHAAENVPAGATVVYSSAIEEENVEMRRAKELNCPLLHRSELLAKLASAKESIAVSGTHGKTTTSALLAHLLEVAELHPSYMVGGVLGNSGSNAELRKGKLFVFEADESDGSFLTAHPNHAIVTNMGFDHVDCYENMEAVRRSFSQFTSQVSGETVWCYDDAELRQLNISGISYGFSKKADAQLTGFCQEGFQTRFTLNYAGKQYKEIVCALPGKHNALNCAAAFVMALTLGAKEILLRKGCASFLGVGRRLEKRGCVREVSVYDDYAHHPTEVRATLKSLRSALQERRLIVLFEPHRFTRFEMLKEEFAASFSEADLLFVTDVHAAGEAARDVDYSDFPGSYIPRSKLLEVVKPLLLPHDVVVTLGAGGITRFSHELFDALQAEPPRKIELALVFGGMSAEREIAQSSKEYIARCLRGDLYQIREVEVTAEGAWQVDGEETDPSAALEGCDLAFPVFHGPYGEDGCMQGLFEVLRVPYVGCNHRAAACAMDKALTKKIAHFHGIPTPSFVEVQSAEFLGDLSYPLFVKACHQGSSIGVVRVAREEALPAALAVAFQVDTSVILEEAVVGREIEFAVLGNSEATVFSPGEVLTGGAFYDYASKYLEEGMQTTTAPDLPAEKIAEGKKLAQRVYHALGCTGMARIDFFYDQEGEFWLNEVNPIPGFTEISLYPKICAQAGLSGEKLVDRLVFCALQRARKAKL